MTFDVASKIEKFMNINYYGYNYSVLKSFFNLFYYFIIIRCHVYFQTKYCVSCIYYSCVDSVNSY